MLTAYIHIIIFIILKSLHCKAGREWIHPISPKTPTPQSQSTEWRKRKTKEERAAQANPLNYRLLFLTQNHYDTILVTACSMVWWRLPQLLAFWVKSTNLHFMVGLSLPTVVKIVPVRGMHLYVNVYWMTQQKWSEYLWPINVYCDLTWAI